MSHSVAVVSIEQVTMELGVTGFQLNDVIGGRLVWGDLLFFTSALRPSRGNVHW